MPNYDFKTLSPVDFEILVRDLLQEELGVRLENFKSGRDRGIDLRYCPSPDNTLIIQCKHYAESSFKILLREVKKHELDKVNKLQPKRYIFVTSLGLTPDQKDELVKIHTPYIQTSGDIFGKNDLNGLLTKYPKIERHTFKLWISSVPVLEEILHSKVKNVSRDALERIQQHARYYVQNKSFPEAIRILDKYNFCIIAGIPGIGKTILAEMLSLHYVRLGYEIVKINGDISEATALDYVNQKRVIYYDDFLGQAALSEKLNKNEDQKLIDFIHAIYKSKASKLILTTREYILHQAQMIYEKLSREKFDAETCIIDLTKYNRLNRAQILYNHIYFSDMPVAFKSAILNGRHYLKIIDHHNYNPRIIDLMTQYSRLQHVLPHDYFKSFMSNLDNPLEVWRHAFEEQLSDGSRNVLVVMTSMPGQVFLEDLQEAFLSYHLKQAKEYQFKTSPNDFLHALKELEGNFIVTEKSKDRTIIRLHNPSIRDFLRDYLASHEQMLRALVQAATFFDQHMILWEFREGQSESLKFRKTLVKYNSEFVHALFSSVNFRICRLIDHQVSKGNTYKSIWDMTFEDRATLVVSVAFRLKTDLSMNLLKQVIDIINQRMIDNYADRDDLIGLLRELKKGEKVSYGLSSTFLTNAKNYFVTDIDSLDSIACFWNFKELFPEVIDSAVIENMKDKFIKVAQQDVWYTPENPDIYREDAYKIEQLSKKFKVNMSDRIEELEDQARELEKEQRPDEPDDYEGYGSGRDSELCSDADIDSIFSTLNK